MGGNMSHDPCNAIIDLVLKVADGLFGIFQSFGRHQLLETEANPKVSVTEQPAIVSDAPAALSDLPAVQQDVTQGHG